MNGLIYALAGIGVFFMAIFIIALPIAIVLVARDHKRERAAKRRETHILFDIEEEGDMQFWITAPEEEMKEVQRFFNEHDGKPLKSTSFTFFTDDGLGHLEYSLIAETSSEEVAEEETNN